MCSTTGIGEIVSGRESTFSSAVGEYGFSAGREMYSGECASSTIFCGEPGDMRGVWFTSGVVSRMDATALESISSGETGGHDGKDAGDEAAAVFSSPGISSWAKIAVTPLGRRPSGASLCGRFLSLSGDTERRKHEKGEERVLSQMKEMINGLLVFVFLLRVSLALRARG